MKHRFLIPLFALLIPVAASAQATDERVGEILSRAQSAGIPAELLQSKIAEGKAKGVPMDRIIPVVERRANALTRAQAVLGKGRSSDELGVAADALQAGVSEAVLSEIASTAPEGRRTVAIAALTALVESGQVPEHALARVKEALARGPDALANLPAQAAARGRAGGGRPANVGRPEGAGRPPAGVPAPGARPGEGRPETPGKPTTPGGKPGGTPGGKPGGGKPGGP